MLVLVFPIKMSVKDVQNKLVYAEQKSAEKLLAMNEIQSLYAMYVKGHFYG